MEMIQAIWPKCLDNHVMNTDSQNNITLKVAAHSSYIKYADLVENPRRSSNENHGQMQEM